MTDNIATGSFYVADGKMIDPNGSVYVARGVDVLEGNQVSADTLQSNLPGINFVRLAVYDFSNPSDLASYVDSLTNKGIVVELEDHSNSTSGNAGGGQGTIFTGDLLNTELNWYSSCASAFKDNPNVWFGTNNEPSEIDSSGNTNAAALSHWQRETYDAIRSTGNNNPIMLEANSWGVDGTNIGYTASDYADMTNVAWDVHYYGWLTNYSTDLSAVSDTLSGIAAAAQQITSADGTMPVIIGEYGNSTDGQSLDANGAQVLTAVQNSGYGSVAWAYLNSYCDGLITADGSLSDFGQEVSNFIASAAANDPAAATSTMMANSLSVSVSDDAAAVVAALPASLSVNHSTITIGSGAVLTDNNGNSWTISDDGTVYENGMAAGYTANVTELALVDGTVWQENASNLWWNWDGANWAGGGNSTSPLN